MFTPLLEQREAEGKPIRVGIIGTGKFGGALAIQVTRAKGMVVSAIADIRPDRAKTAYVNSGIPGDEVRAAETLEEMNDAVAKGRPVVVENGLMLSNCGPIDVVIEATGIPAVGARMAYEAITHGKHIVMVNVETDVTIGPVLRRMADSAGVVYTLVDGDQPGSTMNMVDWARALGFEIVAAGRGTVFYRDDRAGIPDTVPERFGFSQEMIERRTINFKMYNSFRDGSKAQLEMTALANAAGLVPDVRGMHEPSVNLADIPQRFSLVGEGGLLSQHGVVELGNSVSEDGETLMPDPLKMGVFVVMRTDHPFIQEDLAGYNVYPGGDGKNYMLYRPYHLVAVAAPMSVTKAALFGQPTGAPQPTPTAEVITVAKRDLKAGEVLDGSGGYLCNGLCEKAVIARAENLLPLGLADNAVMKADAPQGAAISYDMVQLVEDSFVLKMRRLQDATVW